MTYDTAYLAADFFKHVKKLQEYAGNELHAIKLARALQIRVRVGPLNRSQPERSRIMVQPWWFGDTDVVRHEIAHIMLWWSGLEEEIVQEFGDELGWQVIENLCNHAVAFLRIPPNLVSEAIDHYGVSAQAVQHLRQVTRATPVQALNRLIYDDPHALRAGFLTNGMFIAEVAQCNWSLPFGWSDRIPEPALHFPSRADVSLVRLNSLQTLGVCWG